MLDSLLDLRDLRGADIRTLPGSSCKPAPTANADLTILEAKVAGLLARHLDGSGEGEAVKVTFLGGGAGRATVCPRPRHCRVGLCLSFLEGGPVSASGPRPT